MSKLVSLVMNENMKIFRRPRTWMMILFILAINLAMAIAMKRFEDSAPVSGFLEFMHFSANLTVLVFLFSVVIASEIVAGEFTWGTIKLLLIRPASRSKILLSKYAAVVLFLMALLLVLLIGSALIGIILFGTGGAPGGKASPQSILQTYGFLFVYLLVNVTFAFMISTVFRSSTLAIALSFLVMFSAGPALMLLAAFKHEWAKYLWFANTDLSVYFGGGEPPFEGMTLGFSITVLLVYYALFIGVAWYIFNKRDVAV